MNHVSRVCRERWVCIPVVRELDERDGKRPAATACPCRVIDPQGSAKEVSRVGWEKIPRDDQVAGGIAHAQP